MQQVTLEEASMRLQDLIEAAKSGEDVFITQGKEVTVQLVPRSTQKRKRQFGSARGLITMAPDFDAPLDDFKEYMESQASASRLDER